MRGPPAIHIDDLPGDVSGVFKQKAHRTRDVERAAGAFEQRVRDDTVAYLGIEGPVVRPQDRSRCHRVHPYLGRHFNGQRSRQANQTRLGGAIQRVSRQRPFAMDVRNIDHGATRGLQMRCSGLNQKKRGFQIAADQIVPGGEVDTSQRRGKKTRRVIDQAIESAKMRDRFGYQGRQGVDVQQISLLADSRTRALCIEFSDQRFRSGSRRAVMHHDVGARRVQFGGDRLTDPLGRARHQYRFADHTRLQNTHVHKAQILTEFPYRWREMRPGRAALRGENFPLNWAPPIRAVSQNMNDEIPLDADELMNFAERIEQLPLADAEWVGALFQECLRARMHEAELRVAALDSETSKHDFKVLDEQLGQVALDTAEWLKTLWDVGYMGAGSFPSQPRSSFPLIALEDVLKSALFARIREGKRPLPFPPPTRDGLPWHALVESQEATHVVAADIIRDELGQNIAANIAGCHDWQVVEEVGKDREYVVQHRGKGPLYRLQLDSPGARLRREPPRWTRTIRLQERGGFRSYILEWPQDNGRMQPVSLRATTWERAESEAGHWIATKYPEMYGQVSFERVET